MSAAATRRRSCRSRRRSTAPGSTPRARARVGEPIELALDAARLQFFDPESGKTLLSDASGTQAPAPELAEAAP
jgi:hypothetical protein